MEIIWLGSMLDIRQPGAKEADIGIFTDDDLIDGHLMYLCGLDSIVPINPPLRFEIAPDIRIAGYWLLLHPRNSDLVPLLLRRSFWKMQDVSIAY